MVRASTGRSKQRNPTRATPLSPFAIFVVAAVSAEYYVLCIRMLDAYK